MSLAKTSSRQTDARGITAALAGAAALGILAVQVMVRPEPARAVGVPTVHAQTRRTTPRMRTLGARVVTKPGVAPASMPERSPLAGEAPVRDMFRPLVSETKPAAEPDTKRPAAPSTPAPVLPAAGTAATAPSTHSATASGAPAAAPAATAPSASDVQMLGVIEMDGKVQVLLKKTSTGQSRYFTKGQDAFGMTVEDITDSSVFLGVSGRVQKVAMSSDILIESPGGTAVAGSSGFSGSRSYGGDRGGYDRSRYGDRGGDSRSRDRGDSRGGDSRGRDSNSGSSSALAQVMAAGAWPDRMKKLEEVKAQIEPDRYAKLKAFIQKKIDNKE